MMSDMKTKLGKRFSTIYPKKRILAIHLDGFSHTVIFDSGKKDSEIESESYSMYAPEQSWSINAKKLFADIPHHTYQNNAKELLYIEKKDR